MVDRCANRQAGDAGKEYGAPIVKATKESRNNTHTPKSTGGGEMLLLRSGQSVNVPKACNGHDLQ